MEKEKYNLDIEELWEEDLLDRYPENGHKAKDEYRNYDDPARDTVKEFIELIINTKPSILFKRKKTTFSSSIKKK